MSSPYHRYVDSIESPRSRLSNQSFNQAINQSINQSNNQSHRLLVDSNSFNSDIDSVNGSINESLVESNSFESLIDLNDHEDEYDETINQPHHHSINQPGHLLTGMWSDGLFDCLDNHLICCCSLLIPYCRFGLTVSRARLLSKDHTGDESDDQSINQSNNQTTKPNKKSLNRSFMIGCLLYGVPFFFYTVFYTILNSRYPHTFGTQTPTSYTGTFLALLTLMLFFHTVLMIGAAYVRMRIRRLYEIDGHLIGDLCAHCCCACCALAQEARHVDRDVGLCV